MYLALLGGISLSALPLASAAVIASDDGNAFPAGGSGWGGNWTLTNSTAASDGSVINFTQTGTATDGLMVRNVGYNLNSLTAGQYLQVKYDVIIGSDLSLFTNGNDQIGATLRLDSIPQPASGASGNSTFIIRAYGDTTGGAAQALAWGAYNGGKNNGGFNDLLFTNMGMLIAANTTYSFTIDVHADTLDYDISIFNGTTTVSLADRGWRSTLDGTGTDLVFLGKQNLGTDNFAYGVDNISVSVIPEPGALALFGLAGLAMLRRRRVG
jgi:MYXO-CTERM domain-containing protein